jgi:geranylgeranyl pyrophosphate synthase
MMNQTQKQKKIIDFVVKYGGVEYSYNTAKEYLQKPKVH